MTFVRFDSLAFDAASDVLESLTLMNRSESRGTLRIALREAGLDAACVSRGEIAALARGALPRELAARGVSDAKQVCERLARQLIADDDETASERAGSAS